MTTAQIIALAAQVTSTLVGLLALVIGLRNEFRNQQRFELQLTQSQEIARAAARPLLSIDREGYEDVKAITITNHGPGTAIFRDIKFVRGKKEATDISELVDIQKDDNVEWNEATAFAAPYYLAGKSSQDAFRITAERLRECRIATNRIEKLLADIEGQLDEIEIFISYEDVFGTRYELDEGAD